MDYISVDEFKKQSDKVQKILLEWWKPKFGDLATCQGIDHHYEKYFKKVDNYCYVVYYNKEEEEDKYIDSYGIKLQDMFDTYNGYYSFKSRFDVIPLFIETQVRKFIEEKTKCYVELIVGIRGYIIVLRSKDTIKEVKRISILGHDLLQILWQVACKVAEESV